MGRDQEFQSTLAAENDGFEKTRIVFPRVPRGESMRTRYHPVAQSPRDDKSMWVIVAGVGAVALVIGILPQFDAFQQWTGASGWIQLLRNLFA